MRWCVSSKGPSLRLLPCRFVCGDAFTLRGPATVYTSTGVLHHLRGPDLGAFFQAQDHAGAQAYCHFDIAATALAPLGAWMFHRARMREPLGRHDGVASARRAHDDHTLMLAAGIRLPTWSEGPTHALGASGPSGVGRAPSVFVSQTAGSGICTTLYFD